MNNEKGTARTNPTYALYVILDESCLTKLVAVWRAIIRLSSRRGDSPLSPCSLDRLVHPTKRLLL